MMRLPIISIFCTVFLAGCEKALELQNPKEDAVAVFEECWRVLDERYALFGIKQVDWNEVYQETRPLVQSGTSSEELFSILDQMLKKLKDGHIALISSTDTAIYSGFYKDYPRNFNYTNVLNKYLKPDYRTIGPFQLRILDNVAYIYYRSFADGFTEANLTELFDAIASAQGLIFDVRDNFGGNSGNADKLFSRFIETTRLVKYEVSKNGKAHDALGTPQGHSISPRAPGYFQPIIVLTNRTCFSACNDFVLYMSGLPNCRTMGDQTGGGGSVPQQYQLSNGWTLLFGTTVTLSPAMHEIESGIPASLNIHITSQDESDGKDPIIDAAFQSLR